MKIVSYFLNSCSGTYNFGPLYIIQVAQCVERCIPRIFYFKTEWNFIKEVELPTVLRPGDIPSLVNSAYFIRHSLFHSVFSFSTLI